MDAELKKYLNGVFANNIPQIFLDQLEDIIPLFMQNNNNNESNTITTIRKTSENLSEELTQKWKSINNEDDKILKESYRIFFTTIYLEVYNDKTMPINDKYDTAVYIIKSIEDLSLLKGNEMMNGQKTFFERILRDIKALKKEKKKLKKFDTIQMPVEEIKETEKNIQFKDKKSQDKNKSDIAFKPLLKPNQKRYLFQFIQNENICNAPHSLVDFFVGQYDGRTQIEIKNYDSSKNRNKNTEIDYYRLLFAYLVYELYKKGLIKLNRGKAYREHIEQMICPFSLQAENGQLNKLIRKVQRNEKLKSTIIKHIDDFINKMPKPL